MISNLEVRETQFTFLHYSDQITHTHSFPISRYCLNFAVISRVLLPTAQKRCFSMTTCKCKFLTNLLAFCTVLHNFLKKYRHCITTISKNNVASFFLVVSWLSTKGRGSISLSNFHGQLHYISAISLLSGDTTFCEPLRLLLWLKSRVWGTPHFLV